MADPKVVNLSPITTTDGSVNKITAVLAKTIFYDAFNFDQIPQQIQWMYKDEIVYGQTIRRLTFGRVEIESYADVKGEEFKEKIPKRVNVIEEQYGADLKIVVRSVSSVLANADKFANAGEYEQYVQGMRGMIESVLIGVPHLLLLALVGVIDTTKQAVEEITDFTTGHKLDKHNPQLEELFVQSMTKIKKETGSAKYNDDATWNDIVETFKQIPKIIKNVYVHEDDDNNESADSVNTYGNQLITLAKSVYRSVYQLNSPFPDVNNTIDTEPVASGSPSEQIYASNCKPENLVLLINRTDLLEMKLIFAPGVPNIQEYLDINKFGIGSIVGVDGIPHGCFMLFDKNFMNLHMQYTGVFEHINADLAAKKEVHHWRAKYGWLTKISGLIYITKDWKLPGFKKKPKSS